VLDDGESWVVVRDMKLGKREKRRKWEDDGRLFCLDEHDHLRRQTPKEEMFSRVGLEAVKGRILEYDENADYMSVVRYVQGALKKNEMREEVIRGS